MAASRILPAWVEGGLLLLLLAAVCHPVLTSAAFEVDDYRYLNELRQVDAGHPGAFLQGLVVENRWDRNWWIPEGTFVRFLRPLVLPSYAVDRALWGESSPGAGAAGFLLTNLLLHALATLLVWGCFRRLLGRGWPAFLAAAAFATAGCHMENLDYVAGRTDTLAGIGFFATLLVHLGTRAGRSLRGGLATAAVYFLALLGKELTVFLPALLFLLDWRVPPSKGDPRPTFRQVLRSGRFVWIGCTAALLLYLGIRALALGAEGSGGRPFPYFFLPGREGFLPRTGAVALQYCLGLAAGIPVIPFVARLSDFAHGLSPAWLWAAGLLVPGLFLCAARTSLGRWFGVLFLVTLLPLLPLYSSGRYLYLPSFAWCGALGILAGGLPRLRKSLPRNAGRALLAALVVLPAGIHYRALSRRPVPGGYLRKAPSAERIREEFQPVVERIQDGRPVFLLDFPFLWIEVQFLQPSLEEMFDRELPPVRVLTQAPFHPKYGSTRVHRIDARTLELVRGGFPLHDPKPGLEFDPRKVPAGVRIEEEGYEAEVLEAKDGQAVRLRVHFPEDLAGISLWRFLPREGGGWRLKEVSLPG